MISLIICSTHATLQPSLADNIHKTICADYEIVHVDNSQRKYNIFEAYNLGVERACGEYLCFMHEDIIFRKTGWGKVIERALSCEKVGALGVAGGHVVLNQLDWRFYGFSEVFLIQGNTSVEPKPTYYHSYRAHSSVSKGIRRVAVVDGVWMCIRKELFKKIHFDEEKYHDFHLYDSDICMQINNKGYGVFMTYDVLLEHKSEGTFSKGYRESQNIFFKKWEESLPLIKGITLTKEDIDIVLSKAQHCFEERLKSDTIAAEIKKLIQQKQAGIPTRSFTDEENEFMDHSSFVARKALIKDKSVSFGTAWKHTVEYLKYPFVHHKSKLLLKFFWYRFIKC